MPRSVSFLPLVCFAFATLGCGVMLGHNVIVEDETVLSRSGGLTAEVGTSYSLEVTATFDESVLSADGSLRLLRHGECGRYVEEAVAVRETEVRKPAASGVALDAGILLAGAAGSFLVGGPALQAVVLLGAAAPLLADIAVWRRRGEVSEHTTERQVPEPSAETGPDGRFACETTARRWPPVRFVGEALAGEDGVYRFTVTEATLVAAAETRRARLHFEIDDPAGAVTVETTVAFGPAFEDFIAARDKALRYATPLRLAAYAVRYPRSSAVGAVRRAFFTLTPSLQDTEQLRAVAGLRDLPPEMRRAAQSRYAELRVEELTLSLPEKLLAAWQAERDANTFLLNGYSAEGAARLDEKHKLVAAACTAQSELRVRDERSEAERTQLWRAALDERLDAKSAAVALRWLADCK